jgi:hypothetical protein
MQRSHKRTENTKDLNDLRDYFLNPSDARLDYNYQQGYAWTTLLNQNLYKWKISNVVCAL